MLSHLGRTPYRHGLDDELSSVITHLILQYLGSMGDLSKNFFIYSLIEFSLMLMGICNPVSEVGLPIFVKLLHVFFFHHRVVIAHFFTEFEWRHSLLKVHQFFNVKFNSVPKLAQVYIFAL